MGGVIRRESVSVAPAYSFQDVEREAGAIVARARRQADELLADARRRAAEIGQQAAQELDALRRAGHETGLTEGRRVGLEQIRKEARQTALQTAQDELTRLTQTLSAALAQYEQDRRRLVALAESGLIELSIAIARRVCKTLAGRSSEPVRANARALLELVKHHEDLELHVHPEEHELLQDVAAEFTRQTGQREHVTIKADRTVERGGCVLHTRDGVIDATITAQIERIAAAVCAPDGPLVASTPALDLAPESAAAAPAEPQT